MAEPRTPRARSPYTGLARHAYWRTGVVGRDQFDPGALFQPRFPVSRDMRVVTAGSCFAQHVGRTLREAGFNVLDAEPLPRVSDAVAHRFGYRLYSARYGNIYTARQLAQLFEEAEGRFTPADPVWPRAGRFHDAQRPNVEPEGLDSPELVLEHRRAHLASVSEVFRQADLFVFTFGLTEAWVDRATGTVYPTAPGTIAGSYDPEVHAFKNYDAFEILADFERFREQLRAVNPGVRFLVTVSPVPLAATATGGHVEVATAYSKAVLRAVCGMLTARHEDIDYFPSYETITSQNARGAYYEQDGRSVSERGVHTAMGLFMRAHGVDLAPLAAEAGKAPASLSTEGGHAGGGGRGKGGKGRRGKGKGGRGAGAPGRSRDEVVCEDELLEAFAR